MILIKKFNLSSMGVNCYIIKCDNEFIMIDAPDEINTVIKYLKENEIVISKLLLTHYHFDHILGLDELVSAFPNLEIYCNEHELKHLFDPHYTLGEFYGITSHNKHDVYPLSKLQISGLEIKTISGHSPHSSVYIFNDFKMAFCGDTLFKDTIGRTDIPFGDSSSLIAGIKSNLLTLDDDFIIYPGHGEQTSIGYERKNNAFLK